MNRKENLSLIDDIRRDALILMEQDPSKDYKTASEEARRNLIGDEKVTTVNIKPFKVNISDKLFKKKANLNKDLFLDKLKLELKEIIDVDSFNKAQLEQLVIGKRMQISDEKLRQIADNKYSPEQIKFLCIMITADEDISEYLSNYSFDTEEELKKLSSASK